MENSSSNINFLKKIYYSLFRVRQYGPLCKLGIKQALIYIIKLLFILSIVYAIITTIRMKSSMTKFKDYLNTNLPDFKVEDNALTVNTNERIILDDKMVISNLGGQVVIDTIAEESSLINEYTNTKTPTVLLTRDYFITINQNGNFQKKTYNDVLKENFKNDITTIEKESLLYLFDNISYLYFLLGYIFSYFIAHFLLVNLYVIVLCIIGFIFCKAKKIKIPFQNILAMALYATTITILGFFAINYTTFLLARVIQISFILIPIINIFVAIHTYKWEIL